MGLASIYTIFSIFIVIVFSSHENIASFEPSSVKADHCYCGKGQERNEGFQSSLEGRIVNGYKPIHRPWMVYLKMIYTDNRTGKCGGTLLTNRWIISAGHCFCQKNGETAKLCEKKKKNGRKILKLLWKRHEGEMKKIEAILGINDMNIRNRLHHQGICTNI